MSPLVRPHATAFLDPPGSTPVEQLRTRWDPLMARRIAAHITLVYPEEIPDAAELARLTALASAGSRPFTVALGPLFCTGSPAQGVFFHLDDLDGGLSSFRARAVPAGRQVDFPPHVTIVHPGASGLGEQAWAELASTRLTARFTISQASITAFDGDRWQTLQTYPFAARES